MLHFLKQVKEFEGGFILMKANWGKTEKNKGVLQVEVEAEEVTKAIDQAFKKKAKEVNVPGFRKGKVPRHIFERRFGVEVLYSDALDILLPAAYAEAIDETGIEPVDQPEVDIEQIEKGKALIFKATVTVKPEVELGEYKALEIPEKDFTVKDEDVEEELTRLQERYAELEVIDDGAVEKGDTTVIDFEGFIDGTAFPGGKGERHSLEIGSGSFIPGFEDQLIGMKKEEEKDIVITFPENYQSTELAGKEAVFKVKLHEIKRKKLPELNDEFAKDVDFETLEELKADIKSKLEEKAKQDEENYKKDSVIEKATENANVDIPEVMIKHEIERMVKEFEQQLSYQGMNLDLYYQFSGQNESQLTENFSKDAEKRVKTNLVIEAIAENENMEVSDEDIVKEFERLSEIYKKDADEIKNLITEQDNNLEAFKADIKIRKTIDYLVENSQ